MHSARRSPESDCPLSSQPWLRSAPHRALLTAPRMFPSTLPPVSASAALQTRETKPRRLRTDGADGPAGTSGFVRGKTSLRSLRNDTARPPGSGPGAAGHKADGNARPASALQDRHLRLAEPHGERPPSSSGPPRSPSPAVGRTLRRSPRGLSAWSGPRPHPTASAEGSDAAWPRPRGGGSASPGPAGAGRGGGEGAASFARSYLRGPPGLAGGRAYGEPQRPSPPQESSAGGIVNTEGPRGTLGVGGLRP